MAYYSSGGKSSAISNYSSTATYEANALVLYNGEFYKNISGSSTKGVTPGTDTTVWATINSLKPFDFDNMVYFPGYSLETNEDSNGTLTEIIKDSSGNIFATRTTVTTDTGYTTTTVCSSCGVNITETHTKTDTGFTTSVSGTNGFMIESILLQHDEAASIVETLTAGETSLVITDDRINENSTYDIYTDVAGLNPTEITIENHTMTILFPVQETNVNVKIVISPYLLGVIVEDNLESDSPTKVLSARQGKILNDNKADKTQISNPNLLVNPWFTVNQRGVSEWSNWTYGVDRWKVNSSSASLNSDGTITLIPGCELYNRFEGNPLAGKLATASILLSDGSIISSSGYIEESFEWKLFFETSDGFGHSVRVNSEDNGDLNFAIICSLEASSSLIVRAAKLELGSVSTLANDTPPDYATELLKCQRYYQRYKTITPYGRFGSAGVIRSESEIDISIPFEFKTEMRVNPTISTNGNFDITNGSSSEYAVTSILIDQYTNYGCSLKVKPSASLSQLTGKYFVLRASNDESAYIEFSADL